MKPTRFAGKYASPGFKPLSTPWGAPPPYRRTTERLPSLNPADTPGAYAPKHTTQHYTGDQLLGVVAMHKSNLVPVFNNQAAIDAAHMRRG